MNFLRHRSFKCRAPRRAPNHTIINRISYQTHASNLSVHQLSQLGRMSRWQTCNFNVLHVVTLSIYFCRYHRPANIAPERKLTISIWRALQTSNMRARSRYMIHNLIYDYKNDSSSYYIHITWRSSLRATNICIPTPKSANLRFCQ